MNTTQTPALAMALAPVQESKSPLAEFKEPPKLPNLISLCSIPLDSYI